TSVERILGFGTDSGHTFGTVEIAYETFGTLNSDRSNAILIEHALTGDTSHRVVGGHRRSRRGRGHRRVLRGVREFARRLLGHDRPAVDLRRRIGLRFALPRGLDPGHGPARAQPRPDPRHRLVGGRHRRFHGWGPGPGVRAAGPAEGAQVRDPG